MPPKVADARDVREIKDIKPVTPTWFNRNFIVIILTTLMTVLFSLGGTTVWLMHSSAMDSINDLNKNVETNNKIFNTRIDIMNNDLYSHNNRITTIEVENRNQKAVLEEVRRDVKEQKQTLEDVKADMKVIKAILLKDRNQ